MPRFQTLLECVGQALCEKGELALAGQIAFAEVLPDVAGRAYDYLTGQLGDAEIRMALRDAANARPDDVRQRVKRAVEGLAAAQPVGAVDGLAHYLLQLPPTIRQALRRPVDPDGHTVLDRVALERADDLLPFLPPRFAVHRPGDKPAHLADWELAALRGVGNWGEVWRARSRSEGDPPEVALKFIIDPALQKKIRTDTQAIWKRIQRFEELPGVVPVRVVHLDGDPPCIEYEYVPGCDLTGFIHDLEWRTDHAKPEHAVRIIKRLAEVVGTCHRLDPPLAHGDLKPSNVLVHPHEGKFTLWVGDFALSDLAAVNTLERARPGQKHGDVPFWSFRGAHTPRYASPQMAKREPPTPRDDVHALGVIWYQLLKRDTRVGPPVGTDWAEEFWDVGLTDAQARLLTACVATRPDKRPADCAALVDAINDALAGTSGEAPKSFIFRGPPPKPAGSAPSPVLAAGPGVPRPPAEPLAPGGLPKVLRNWLGMQLVLIPAGEFPMGSSESETGRKPHEGPLHEVTITRPFYLGVCPVTQAQFEAVMGKNPSQFNKSHAGGPDHPVEQVSWDDAATFCQRLSAYPEEKRLGRAYRLPTEAEWEYACRAGTITPFSFGDNLTAQQANFAGPAGSAHYKLKEMSHRKTSAVGSFPANDFRLFDMHGNVQEWCADWYDEFYYFECERADPAGPPAGTMRVVRGGSWSQFDTDCRSAARMEHSPGARANNIGFRVAFTPGG
jgi:formylglycine-generating enzyme required for sulfatase activity